MRSAALLLLALVLMAAAPPNDRAGPPNDATLSGADTDAERTLSGPIGSRSHELVAKWLRANPHRALTLALNSPGGRALFGARSYEAMVAHGQVATVVPSGALCLSACGYLWLAGASRTVADRAALGFHSASCSDGPCNLHGVGSVNQSLLDILARTEPELAVLLSNTGAMVAGNTLLALALRHAGHWQIRTLQPPS